MMFAPPVRRVDTMRGGKPTHHYIDGEGRRIPGVTAILDDGVPKPALAHWAGNTTAAYAVDNWETLNGASHSERLKTLRGCRYAVTDAAKDRGTEVHALAEALVNGQSVDVPAVLAGMVDGYVAWLDEWSVRPAFTEVSVVNYTIGYAGTLDLVARLADGATWLLDIKTNKGDLPSERKHVYSTTALQLAAYRHAEFYVDAAGIERPMPDVDACGVIHVTHHGTSLYPVDAGARALLDFRYAAKVAQFMDHGDEYIHESITRGTT